MTQPEDEHDGRATVPEYSEPPQARDGWRAVTYHPGTFIGEVWEVEQTLGKGGMGSVYRCHNRYAPRILAAIKLLDPAFQFHPEAKARFLREAEILYTVDHPNVVKVSNVLLDATPPYLEMEFVDGLALETELGQRGPLPARVAVKRTKQLAHALRYLHRKGIYHRDVKPQNILIRKDGEPKLVDFGLAVEVNGDRITQQAQVNFGTVSYCPPEWGQATHLDPAAWDLYALGVVLYEMLTGSVAFPVMPDADARRQMVQVMTDKQRVQALDPGPRFPMQLRKVVRELTHRDPEQRIRSAKDLLTELDAVDLTTQAPAPDPVSEVPDPVPVVLPVPTVAPLPATPWLTALSFLASVMVMGLLLGLGVGGLALYLLQPVVQYRDAQVVLQGASGIPASVRVADQPASRVEGQRHHFKRLPVGEVEILWSVGEGCDAACEACPPWCRSGVETRTLVPEGSDELSIAIPMAPMHPVRIGAAGTDKGFVRIGSLEMPFVSGVVDLDLPPGQHQMVAGLGECKANCTGEDCGETCQFVERNLVVPAQGRMPVTVLTYAPEEELEEEELEEPEDELADRPDSAPKPRPVSPDAADAVSDPETPSPPPTTSGKRVTRRAFAKWLSSHPEWKRETAIAEGRADGDYLSGWKGMRPPSPGRNAVTRLPWAAAKAYCASKGGLAAVNAPPTLWASGPNKEWRAGPGPTWLAMTGEAQSAGETTTDPGIGFRCAQ